MNDAHIYCTKEQFAQEFRAVNEMYLKYFKIFGIDKYVMRLSLHDPKKLGQKYINEPELWLETEAMVRAVLIETGTPFVEVQDEGAFYGPKIDVQIWSIIGREFTLATNQVDFAQGKRFNLNFTNKDNEPETPLIIHRAPLGTHERFIGFLLEHYAGKLPLWLAPIQVKILPISDKFADYGLISYLNVEVSDNGSLLVNDWLMSCRVFSRKLEIFILICDIIFDLYFAFAIDSLHSLHSLIFFNDSICLLCINSSLDMFHVFVSTLNLGIFSLYSFSFSFLNLLLV
jgi:hypothetical protein